jgi:two-component system chemotaxis response regulator CheB
MQTHGNGPGGQRDLVVIGASAGGVDALQEVVACLPAEFPAAVLVVLHVAASGTSVLPAILTRRGALPASFARDGEEILRGQIFVAPADHHMLVHDGRIRLTKGPRENGHRPAIDPLFRSAARSNNGRTIGVILSGLLDDGASGLRFVEQSGGATVVQDPEDAQFASMPHAAMHLTRVDRVVSAKQMGETLCALIDQPIGRDAGSRSAGDGDGLHGPDRLELDDPSDTAELLEGPPSGLTCPDCGGALWEHVNGNEVRFACHVGHAFSLASLQEEQGRSLEGTLWSAVRALEERADLHRRLARRTSAPRGEACEDRAREAEGHAHTLRQMLETAGQLPPPAPDDA